MIQTYTFPNADAQMLSFQSWLAIFTIFVLGSAFISSKFWTGSVRRKPFFIGAMVSVCIGLPVVLFNYNSLSSTFHRLEISDHSVQMAMVHPAGSLIEILPAMVTGVYFGFPGKGPSCYVRIETAEGRSYKSTLVTGDVCKTRFQQIKSRLVRQAA